MEGLTSHFNQVQRVVQNDKLTPLTYTVQIVYLVRRRDGEKESVERRGLIYYLVGRMKGGKEEVR